MYWEIDQCQSLRKASSLKALPKRAVSLCFLLEPQHVSTFISTLRFPTKINDGIEVKWSPSVLDDIQSHDVSVL